MQTTNRRIWLGIIFIALGGLFLLDNFKIFYFDFRDLFFSGHTILLIIGTIFLVNHKNSLVGYILIGLGLIGVLRHLLPTFLFDFTFGDLWPILLLVFGLWMVLHRRDRELRHNIQMSAEGIAQNINASSYDADLIDVVSAFTSVNRIVNSQNFRGGKVTTLFAGTKLDLSSAKLAPGEHTLELTTLFGGATIRVPQNWKVILNVTSILGGFDDKRFAQFSNPEVSEGILVVKGITLFGGGELLY